MAYFDGIKRLQVGSDGGLDTNGAKVAGVGHDVNVYYNIETERFEENKDEFKSPGAGAAEDNITIFEDGEWVQNAPETLASNDNYVFIAQNPEWEDVKTDTDGDGVADITDNFMSDIRSKHLPI